MGQLISGIFILIITITFLLISIFRTPDNLRGWYGVMFGLISIGGIVGGIVLIAFGILALI